MKECKPLPPSASSTSTAAAAGSATTNQGLTLVHVSAQLEACLTQEHTLHTLYTP